MSSLAITQVSCMPSVLTGEGSSEMQSPNASLRLVSAWAADPPRHVDHRFHLVIVGRAVGAGDYRTVIGKVDVAEVLDVGEGHRRAGVAGEVVLHLEPRSVVNEK